MLVSWLFHACLGSTLLIGLVLLLRPWVRRCLGAQVVYWLWLLPPLQLLLDRLQGPGAVLISTVLPGGGRMLQVLPRPGTVVLPAAWPLEWLWLAGVATCCLYRCLAWWRAQRRLRQHSVLAEAAPLLAAWPDLAAPARVDYRVTDLPGAPFVAGLLRPCVYLPGDFAQRFGEGRMRWVLLHEFAHIRRHDLWAQLLAECLRALFWFNPAVHIAWFLFCQDQELACDHAVLRARSRVDRHAYGQALLHALHAPAYAQTLSFSTDPKERFIMLEQHKQSRFAQAAGLLLCGAVAAFAVAQPAAEVAHAAPWEKQLISLNFQQVPLATVVATMFQFAGQTPAGLDRLPATPVDIRLKDVPLDSALAVLLGCNGYSWRAAGKGYEVVANPAGVAADPVRCVHEGAKGAP
jgi:beta-lactamase regulating signal transducer with metallopeptidase domain